ncbi:MAG: alpha/beta fold hydrolase [Thermoguttaceae bacterium]|jgi:pimeloyl-ACP methyl ester carboxylesterase
MVSLWQKCDRKSDVICRQRPRVVLINGLAAQAESWYRNVDCWRRHFELHTPALVDYESDALHNRIDARLPVDVNFFVEELHLYLRSFVQQRPVHLLANSMGGKVAVEFAVRFPDLIASLVLLSPSGLSREERLPMIGGVKRSNVQSIVESVFYDPRHARQEVMECYRRNYTSRRWRIGAMRIIRGTMGHSVRDLMPLVQQPTLVIVGREDRIVDCNESIEAARNLPDGRIVILNHCGHAPQIEKAAAVNRLVAKFIRSQTRATSATDDCPISALVQ